MLRALQIGTLCHDIDHPGMDNAFQVRCRAVCRRTVYRCVCTRRVCQVKSLSDLALRYNDTSVLENHHAAVTFSVLMTPETALVGALSRWGLLARVTAWPLL